MYLFEVEKSLQVLKWKKVRGVISTMMTMNKIVIRFSFRSFQCMHMCVCVYVWIFVCVFHRLKLIDRRSNIILARLLNPFIPPSTTTFLCCFIAIITIRARFLLFSSFFSLDFALFFYKHHHFLYFIKIYIFLYLFLLKV